MKELKFKKNQTLEKDDLRMALFDEDDEEEKAVEVVEVVVFLPRPRISSKDTMARLAKDPSEHKVSSSPNWPDLIA